MLSIPSSWRPRREAHRRSRPRLRLPLSRHPSPESPRSRGRALGVAALAQACGFGCAFGASIAWVAMPCAAAGLLHGAVAGALGARWGLPRWWHVLNLVLPLAAWTLPAL